jgi:uncharacterized membrane protein
VNNPACNNLLANQKALRKRLSKTMLFALATSWTLALTPCVLILAQIIRYHLGITEEPPVVYTNNAVAVIITLYAAFILSNLAYVIVFCYRDSKENKIDHKETVDSLF